MRNDAQLADALVQEPLVAVLIPFPRWDKWCAECVQACAALDYTHLQIWLLPDEALPSGQEAEARARGGARPIRIVATGAVNPAAKRNVALRAMTTPWAALVDADAYPRSDWLRQAFREMKDDVAIVAGPNLTPLEDPYRRQLSGLVMRSPLGFGPAYVRHHPVPRHEPGEMPTCNMLIRRLPNIFFREEFSTAEDMMYCRDVKAAGYRIVYSPDVVVFHHRRRFPCDLARQFYFYGRDKGRLFARGSRASRLPHMLPALLVVYALLLPLFLVWAPGASQVRRLLLSPGLAYAVLVLLESIRCARNPLIALGGLLAFPLAHTSYGAGYWAGVPQGRRERD